MDESGGHMLSEARLAHKDKSSQSYLHMKSTNLNLEVENGMVVPKFWED